MDKFGYLDQLNGMGQLPFWSEEPCTNITASEGSFFPPREYTETNMRYVYDKDLCRIIPLEFREAVYKDGIPADLYELPENAYGDSAQNPNNSCFDTDDYKPVRGLQNISPCQYSECISVSTWLDSLPINAFPSPPGAPVYISNPHFYLSDPKLLSAVEGLKPNKTIHKSYFKIQPVSVAKSGDASAGEFNH